MGGEEFVERVRGMIKGDGKEQSGLRQLQRVCGIGKVIEFVERAKGEKWAEFRNRGLRTGRGVVSGAEVVRDEVAGVGGTGGRCG